MDLKSATKNQHFLSQTEQRLNAINSGSCNPKSPRIYEFELVDRENHEIKLRSKRGALIENTLSLHDLFSFDILDRKGDRENFEELFNQYEPMIKLTTLELLRKIQITSEDIGSEIVNLFSMKFLNFIRNPYSIKKILNTFPTLMNIQPTDPVHLENFKKVLAGRKPHQEYLCRTLNVSKKDYIAWLAVIFLLLTPVAEGGQNFLNDTVRGLFESRDLFMMVIIYTYDDHACLLSDRGFSEPLVSGNDRMAFDFNLYSQGFIRYTFSTIDLVSPPGTPKRIIDLFKETKQVMVHHHHNDLEALKKYNQHVIYQCYKNVFSSQSTCFGV
ncbi:hypothetical protein [Pseudomonas azerbaijanoccidentalis]